LFRVIKSDYVSYDGENAVRIEVPAFEEPLNVADEPVDLEEETVDADPLAEVRAEAARILGEAKAGADRVTEKAEADAEAIRTEARVKRDELYREGNQTGYTDGYKRGYGEGSAEADKLISDAQEVLRNARERRSAMIAGVEGEMVDLISGIARKLINRAVSTEPGTILTLIRLGFDEATVLGDVRIRVSKDDYDFVTENADAIMAMAKSGTSVDFVKDLSLNKGDCVIETPYGNIDCSLGQQFEALENNLYMLMSSEGSGAAGEIDG